ncbi:twin-arginine translocase TatA/TatE family subunit [Marinoscillum pacificum]|uniref:twin-arginine translocase TatA/TatE family subunit n=1 Tax=Marinoscillum pacificum TaxID=392723 RepID=UPI00358F542F|tara:strand:- start:23 stop:241 length:219 start_codon:yes stop_codon:yes gene_type:complete
MNDMNTVLAFGMPGGWELIVIILFVIIFFGAKKIPEIARGMGKGIREFKDATKEIKNEIDEASVDTGDSKKK